MVVIIITFVLSIILLGCSSGSGSSSGAGSASQNPVNNATYAIGSDNRLYLSTSSGVWGLMPNKLTSESDIINNLNCGSSNCGFVTQDGNLYISSNLVNWSNMSISSLKSKNLKLSLALYGLIMSIYYSTSTSSLNKNLTNIITPSIAVGQDGTIVTFDNQGNMQQTSVGSSTLRSVTQFTSGGKYSFIVVGDNGAILKSTDGYHWYTVTNVPTTANLNQVISLDNASLIAIGNGGIILKSSDGVNWSTIVSNTKQNLTTINYSAGVYTIGGTDGTILLSSNGKTWMTPVVVPDNITNYNITQIGRLSSGGFIAYAASNDGSPEILLESQYGTIWTTVGFGATQASGGILSVALFFRTLGNLYAPNITSISPVATSSNTANAVAKASSYYTVTYHF